MGNLMKEHRLVLNVTEPALDRINELLEAFPNESISSIIRRSLGFCAMVIHHRMSAPDGILVLRDQAGKENEIIFPDAGSIAQPQHLRALAKASGEKRRMIEVRLEDSDEAHLTVIQTYLGCANKTSAVSIALGVFKEVLEYSLNDFKPYFESAGREVMLQIVSNSPILVPNEVVPSEDLDHIWDPPRLVPLPLLANWEVRDNPTMLLIASQRHAIRGRERAAFVAPMRENLRRKVRYVYACWSDADVRDLIGAIKDHVLPEVDDKAAGKEWYETEVFSLIEVVQIDRSAASAHEAMQIALDLFPCGKELWLKTTAANAVEGFGIKMAKNSIEGGWSLTSKECEEQRKRLMALGPVALVETEQFEKMLEKVRPQPNRTKKSKAKGSRRRHRARVTYIPGSN